jgi:AraC-like DNA-binding protein/mannose-6-phosphate isomerase-like protein (cupin superfamily)
MRFSSNSLPFSERAAGYEAALRQYFSSFGTQIQVQVEAPGSSPVEASLDEFTLGTLSGAVHCSNVPHLLHAKPNLHDESAMDFYVVRKGHICFMDDEGSVELAAGDMALLRTDLEFQARSARIEMIAVGLPESLLGTRAGKHWWRVTRRFRGDIGYAACLASLLSTAAARHRELSAAEGTMLQTAVIDAIAFLGDSDPEDDCGGLSPQQRDKLSHVKALVLRSLPLQSMDPASVAREAGISVRTLHRLFNASGSSFREWLRERRLERCWSELTDPGRLRTTIAAIAFGWGFSDLRTFNRAFVTKYGMNPWLVRELTRNRETSKLLVGS